MTWVTKWLIADVLATVFGTAVHGLNSCFTTAKCAVTDTGYLALGYCSIVDADLGDLASCLDTAGRSSITTLSIYSNSIATIPSDLFESMTALDSLNFGKNDLTALPSGIFSGLAVLETSYMNNNELTTFPSGIFDDLGAVELLNIAENALTTLPAGIFENLPSTAISASGSTTSAGQEISTTTGCCECSDLTTCDAGLFCNPGTEGYTCDATETSGDPHMTGFRGQQFDFTGKDDGWYAVVSDFPYMHVNMRVTSPVPSVLEITYITGISIITADTRGRDHTIVISVKNPHSMESSCPAGVTFCLGDGALHVIVDGEQALINASEVTIAPGVAIGAVNLPGACRSFGFKKYWERKVELLSQAGRGLSLMSDMQDMSDWVLADATATNMAECAEYVAQATAVGGVGMLAHQSEHASFQIITPTATIRLTHGRLHQLPMRNPTDQFDLPDHLTWQMNLAVDHSDMYLDATGILGETLVPTVDEHGASIMQGMGAIRGAQEDCQGSCRVENGHSSGDVGRLVHGHSVLFEPALGGSDARCSCETVDRVSIMVTEFNKHRLPVNKSCTFRHSGGIGIGKIQGRAAAKDSPCTFLDGSQITNHHELWLCMHEAGCDITDDWLQMAVCRDPRPAIVSTFFYIETHLGMDARDLDAFVTRELPIMCQWLAARYIFFVGILGDQSIEVWYSDAMEDPLACHYDWLYFVGLQLPFDTVEAMAHAAAADDLDFEHKSVDLHPGEEATTVNGLRPFEDEVSSETVKLSDAILRAWLPPVRLERCDVMP